MGLVNLIAAGKWDACALVFNCFLSLSLSLSLFAISSYFPCFVAAVDCEKRNYALPW